MHYHKAIKKVHSVFKGIVSHLAELTGTSEEWWRSHGRPPSTFNQQNSGKAWSNIEKYLEGIALYEEAAKGAGVMLSAEIHQMIRCRYTDCGRIDQRALVNAVIKESSEAAAAANKKDFNEMTPEELQTAHDEAIEARDAHQKNLDAIDEIMRTRSEKRDIESRYIYSGVN